MMRFTRAHALLFFAGTHLGCSDFEFDRAVRPVAAAPESSPSTSDPSGRAPGGGEGYQLWLDPPSDVVSTKQQLLARLEAAQPGEVVYVDDEARIDLTGLWEIEIPAQVTLASGRGRHGSLGGLLFTTLRERATLLRARGPDVRVTGLRIRGPSWEIDGADCGGQDAVGIGVAASAAESLRIEVDNCELFAWPGAAIQLTQSDQALVHHNHIHHNRREERTSGCTAYGLGYAVSVDRGVATIEGNLFDHNRHDIKSDGLPTSSYTARYNMSVEGLIGHSFDMHGCSDSPELDYCQENPAGAGDYLEVTHNTFLDPSHPGVLIRGVPRVGAWISFNRFGHASAVAGLSQINAHGNVISAENEYAATPEQAWFVAPADNDSPVTTQPWRFRRFAQQSVAEVGFADFDGDRAADAFWADGESWYVSWGAREPWQVLRVSGHLVSELHFADFDADGRTDVLLATDEAWLVSWAGRSDWEPLRAQGAVASDLATGDFDGDGQADIFRALGAEWEVSWAGRSEWELLAVSDVALADLRFGDFDGDGRTDVLRSDGEQWLVAFAAAPHWQTLRASEVALSSLRFCDFDGDGATDVFHSNGEQWQVSWSAVSSWHQVGAGPAAVDSLGLADFNADGRCDILMARSPWGR